MRKDAAWVELEYKAEALAALVHKAAVADNNIALERMAEEHIVLEDKRYNPASRLF